MHIHDLQYVFLAATAVALAFMFWFLWSVTRQLKTERESAQKQPSIPVIVDSRYARGAFAPLPQWRETQHLPQGPRAKEALPLIPTQRRYSAMPAAPALEPGFMRATSNRAQGVRS